MRRYNREIKSIKKVYDAKLKELFLQDKEAVLAYVWYKRIYKPSVSKERRQELIREAFNEFEIKGLSYNEFISYLIEKQEKVKDILQEFKTDIVNQLVEKGTRVNHVTRYSPKNLNYVIKPNLAETMYNERIGNFLFASIEDISKLRYAVRTSTGGMFRIGENMVIFPTNKDLKICDGRLLLNNAVYVYSLDVKYFEPVVTIRIDTHGKGKQPTIVFDDEWVSTEPIYVTDEVCEKIEDVTELLDYFKVFVFNNNKREENSQVALRLVSKPQRDVKTFLTKSMKEGKISFVNALIKESRLQEELSNK